MEVRPTSIELFLEAISVPHGLTEKLIRACQILGSTRAMFTKVAYARNAALPIRLRSTYRVRHTTSGLPTTIVVAV
jgi:hypothetical protein